MSAGNIELTSASANVSAYQVHVNLKIGYQIQNKLENGGPKVHQKFDRHNGFKNLNASLILANIDNG